MSCNIAYILRFLFCIRYHFYVSGDILAGYTFCHSGCTLRFLSSMYSVMHIILSLKSSCNWQAKPVAAWGWYCSYKTRSVRKAPASVEDCSTDTWNFNNPWKLRFGPYSSFGPWHWQITSPFGFDSACIVNGFFHICVLEIQNLATLIHIVRFVHECVRLSCSTGSCHTGCTETPFPLHVCYISCLQTERDWWLDWLHVKWFSPVPDCVIRTR